MKKSLLILPVFLSLFFAQKTNAQTIPNADFETWTNGVPNGWGTYFPTVAVTQSSDKQSGTYSVKMETDPNFGVSILSLNNGNMVASNTCSSFLNGYIKASLSANDTFQVAAYFTRNSDQAEAGGEDVTSLSRSTWTPFHITINKLPGYIPDSFAIIFFLNPDISSTSSYVMIDNLSFSNTAIGTELGTQMAVGIKNVSKQNINSSLYPNPANGNAEINFTLVSASHINIKIYDIAGRCVKSVINESRNSGAQKVLLNTDDIQNGIYFYTITGDRFTETKKFVVSK